MKWMLFIGGGLAVVVGVVAVIGAMLPRNHVATASGTIRARPEVVWALISDTTTTPTWRGVRKIEWLDGHKRWKEYGKFGPMTFELVDARAPTRMVTRVADDGGNFGGTWTVTLAPAAEGGDSTTVTITEEGFVSNPIFRFMSRYVFGHYASEEAYLRALGAKFGHEVTPVRL